MPQARERSRGGRPQHGGGSSQPPRTGSSRDRHGRGMRGPLVVGGAFPDVDVRVPRPRDRFDDLVISLVDRHLRRWPDELKDVEFATEDVPDMPDDWGDDPMPLGALIKPRAGRAARIVLFRRPVEMRAGTRIERLSLVNEVLVEHIAELLGREPSEVDPGGLDGDL